MKSKFCKNFSFIHNFYRFIVRFIEDFYDLLRLISEIAPAFPRFLQLLGDLQDFAKIFSVVKIY